MKPNMIQTDNILNGLVSLNHRVKVNRQLRANISVSEIDVLLRASK